MLREGFKYSVTTNASFCLFVASYMLQLISSAWAYPQAVGRWDLSNYFCLSIINVRSHCLFLLQLGSDEAVELRAQSMEET